MSENNCDYIAKLELWAKILIRCFIIGAVFLLFAFFMVVIFKDFALQIHADLMGIPLEDVRVEIYSGLMMVKSFIFLLFLVPFVAIKMVICKAKKQKCETSAKE